MLEFGFGILAKLLLFFLELADGVLSLLERDTLSYSNFSDSLSHTRLNTLWEYRLDHTQFHIDFIFSGGLV